jgi:hypothetical protein
MRRVLRLRSRRGQSVVEFTLILPVMMFLFLGMVEMGFAINHNVTTQTATRQGSRVGSVLVNGTNKCNSTDTAAADLVDPQIIGAVEGALVSPGSMTDPTQVQSIVIFGAKADGSSLGSNTWKYAPGGGPLLPGAGQPLDFKYFGGNWPAIGRCGAVTGPLPNGGAAQIGVRITYKYRFMTPLGAIIGAFSSGTITMTDETTMALEPPTP